MKFRLALLVLAVLPAACVHQTVASGTKPAPSVWDRQIRNAKDAGDGDYQLNALRAKVAAESDNIPARLELAKTYRERGYPDVALEICRLAAARFPESGEVQLALAGALRDSNRRNEAISGLEAFLQAHPQAGPEYQSWLGILHDEGRQWAEGEPAWRKALEQRPQADYLHNNLGYNLLMQKRYDESAGEFREALKLNAQSQVARNNLGLALAWQNSASEAIATWQSGSDPATAHNNLAAVLMEKGNYPAARKELEIALGYNRTFQPAIQNLELVSRLDGQPVLFPVKRDQTFWDRFKRLWVGPLDDSGKDAVRTASVPATGETK
ncbi:MAG TPA: tetratricopeptide repeat protein [Bryobacteraceae bacterium]|nr:tetratricopeptide repeat protein [Bryobacteraceae bacterium]